jgi:hypothetical protein
MATTPATAPTSIPPTVFALAAPVNVGVLVGKLPVPFAKPPFGFKVGVATAAGVDAGGALFAGEEAAPGGQEV